MQTRTIGPVTVSAIGLGGMPMSIEGRPDEARSARTIHAALDAGVTLIDTADAYHLEARRDRPQRAAHRKGPGELPGRHQRRAGGHQGRALLAKAPVVIPIPGASRPESIIDSAQAPELVLTPEEFARLDGVNASRG
jgi:aryl-alcohol dehydrogenase-like predicted oxidoreductase